MLTVLMLDLCWLVINFCWHMLDLCGLMLDLCRHMLDYPFRVWPVPQRGEGVNSSRGLFIKAMPSVMKASAKYQFGWLGEVVTLNENHENECRTQAVKQPGANLAHIRQRWCAIYSGGRRNNCQRPSTEAGMGFSTAPSLPPSKVTVVYIGPRRFNSLQAFHMRCQRQLMCVRWDDFVTNTHISSVTGLDNMFNHQSETP